MGWFVQGQKKRALSPTACVHVLAPGIHESSYKLYKHLQSREAGKSQRRCWLCSQSLCVVMKQRYAGELERTDHTGGKIVVGLPC